MFEVYCLTSPSGKRYVGFTSAGADQRWAAHVRDAKSDSDFPLHRAIRKYGPESFTRTLLERMTTEAGAKRAEQLWIKELGTFVGGYNATLGGDGNTGWIPSAETRARMSESQRGRKHSPETRAKMAESKRGVVFSQDTCAKISKATRGKKRSLEACAKIGDAKRGTKHSPETRARMSASAIGRVFSPEHCANLSKAATLREANKKLKREGE
jgi:group I intron endonuclease